MAAKDEGLLFERGLLKDWSGFVLRALGRHWFVASMVFIGIVGLAVAAGTYLPKSYVAKAKLLAMPPEGAPGTVAAEGTGAQSNLAGAAAQVVLSRDALKQIAAENNLLERWEATRSPALKLKDAVIQRISSEPMPTDTDREDALLAVMEKRLSVSVEDHAIEVAVSWPDPVAARDIVESARKMLIEARREAELSPLEEKAKTLAAQLSAAQARVDQGVAELQTETNRKRKGAKAATVRSLQAEGRWRDLPDPRLSQLRLQILAKRKAITELEDVRRRRLTDLNAQLSEQKASLGPNHPNLLDTKEKLAALERQAPQLDALRGEEQALVADYVRLGGKDNDLSADPGPLWPVELNDDPKLTYAKSRVELDLQNVQTLLRDSADAEVQLASAKAAFPARYAVIQPALLPARSASPALWQFLLAGLAAGFLLSAFAATTRDLLSGRITETWQVQRWARLKVLGEVPESAALMALNKEPRA